MLFMENSEIDRQLGELWKKASGKDYLPELPVLSSRLTESQIETVQFLKNNFSKAASDWKRLLDVKESSIRDLSAQLAETRTHLGELKQYCLETGEKAISEEITAALNLGESVKALEDQKRRHAGEAALLKEILERTRAELSGLSGRLEVLRAGREEWKKKFTEASVEQANLKDAAAGLEYRLGEARGALEKTLSELGTERRARVDAEQQIKKAEKKAADLESQLAEAKSDLNAGRMERGELRDRERAVRENKLKTD